MVTINNKLQKTRQVHFVQKPSKNSISVQLSIFGLFQYLVLVFKNYGYRIGFSVYHPMIRAFFSFSDFLMLQTNMADKLIPLKYRLWEKLSFCSTGNFQESFHWWGGRIL